MHQTWLMRAAVAVVCLLLSGCSVMDMFRGRDRDVVEEEPPVARRAEPPQKPSDVLKAPRPDIASPVSDYFYVRGGYFMPKATTTLRLDSGIGTPGTVLSGEDDLGLSDAPDQGSAEFMIRMRERNRLRVNFLQLDRDSRVDLTRNINFGDQVFLLDDRVATLLDWRMISMTYTYSIFKRERFELGAGLGVHVLVAEARGSVPARNQRERATGAGVFPTIAADAAFRISKRWAVAARGQQFSTKVGGFDGSISDYHLDVQYRMRRNFAIGLGYTATKVNVEVTDSDFPGLFDIDVKGPEIFLRASF